ncbi:MAG: MFS transporter [Pseudomonadota bacterium]
MSFLGTKTSRAIVKEGSLDAVKIGAAETYFGAFGVFLGGTPLLIGALATVPPLIGAMAQTVGMQLAERVKSRRNAIVQCIQVQALLCLLFGCVALTTSSGTRPLWILIALVSLYHVTIGLIAPLWNSLIGDLVPPTSRGDFFGYRNKWMAIVTFAGVVAAGETIHFFAGQGYGAIGYVGIFALAALSRFLSGRFMRAVPDVAMHIPDGSKFSFWQFIVRARQSNFVRFVLFVSAMNFATAISGPYFAMYMLNDLRFSYREYMIVVSAVVLVQFAVMRSWGALSDQFGNRQIMRVCGALVSINPLLWLISSNFWWVILIQLYSGLFWAGFNLAAANFVFDAVTAPKRARCFAYQSIVNGVLVFVGSAIGGYIASNVSIAANAPLALLVAESSFLVLFVSSGVLRIAVMLFLFPAFAEVRKVQRVRGYQLLVRVVSLRPLWGATFGVVSDKRRKADGGNDLA